MAELDHWHPVRKSDEVGDQPVGVKLADREMVLFRDARGRVAALEDVCPHRGMRLSCGRVERGNIVCPYHGWAFDADGAAVVPPARNKHARAMRYDAVERHGLVWVKNADAVARFPDLGVSGYHYICTLRRHVMAPMELVLDNFIEVEHTADIHAFLGYEDIDEVETKVEVTETSVRVFNRGPQKPIPKILWLIAGFKTGDVFTDDWTTYFSPVHTIYDQYWQDPDTGELREKLRLPVFFNPIGDDETELVVQVYSLSPPTGRFGLNLLAYLTLPIFTDLEIGLDIETIENLADKSVDLTGRKLSRFDTALFKARERIERIYRGESPGAA